MNMETINRHWKFHYGDVPPAFQKDFPDVDWQTVSVPHDWSVTMPFDRNCSSGTGYLPGGTAWYRKHFTLPAQAEGGRVRLVFDGIYKNARIWVNSYYLGMWPYGYSEICLDITDFACFGETENVVSVRVEREDLADSRWFTGCGIYRKVTVETAPSVCFAHHGVFFATRSVSDGAAEVVVSAEVENHTGESVTVPVHHELIGPDGAPALSLEGAAEVAPGETKTVVLSGSVSNPALWSDKTPVLYRLVSTAADDRQETAVGVRSFRFDPDEGFFCNGENKKLKGVCVHHDAGTLGAAVYRKTWARRLRKFKDMGCNAIRMSHNPMMPELYDLCDEMGFYVIDEAFDEWEGCKNKWSTGHNVYPPKHYGYSEYFPQWHEHDLKTMIRRDRNHPCVMMWSIGNEIDYPNDPYCHPSFTTMTGNNDANKPAQERMYNPAKPNMERLTKLAAMLADEAREEDATRPITAAVAFPELSTYLGYIDCMDVVGYNYKEEFYERDHARFPQKPFFGSENSYTLEAWKAVRDSKNIFGQFIWTGADFFGETVLWPMHGSSAGHLTTAGFEKPQFYFRRGLWAEGETAGLVTARAPAKEKEQYEFFRSWNYVPGEPVEIRCYSSAGAPRVTLNGRELPMEDCTSDLGAYRCEIPFEAGELRAVVGRAEDVLCTTGAPVALRLTVVGDLCAGGDVCQVEVEVVDGEGRLVPDAGDRLHIAVEGAAELIAADNGDLYDPTDCQSPVRRAHQGRMLLTIRSLDEPGAATVTVSAESLRPQAVTIEVK